MSGKKSSLDEDQLVADMMNNGYGLMLSRGEVERALGISKAQAYLLIRDGQLESTRLSTHFRVPVRSVARYLAMGAKPPKPS